MGDQSIDAMVRRIVAEELRGRDPRLVEQGISPLGPRVHCAAVRRRIAEVESGERPVAGAYIRGRAHFLTQEALAEELGRGQKPGLRKAERRAEAETQAEGAEPAEAFTEPTPDITAREQAAYDRLTTRYRGIKRGANGGHS